MINSRCFKITRKRFLNKMELRLTFISFVIIHSFESYLLISYFYLTMLVKLYTWHAGQKVLLSLIIMLESVSLHIKNILSTSIIVVCLVSKLPQIHRVIKSDAVRGMFFRMRFRHLSTSALLHGYFFPSLFYTNAN